MLYSELRRKSCTGYKEYKANELIQGILKRNSNYFRIKNIISRILQWHPAHKEKSLSDLSHLAENKIFQEYQKEASTYIKNFRGNMFYTFQQENILMLKGRDTIHGETKYKLVPTKSLLYDRITETYHAKYHRMAGSPVYIRAQMLSDGYYVPHVVKRLSSLQDKCPHCRGRIKRSLHTAMGQVGEKRLNCSAPFTSSQADLIGPYSVKEYFNTRGTRKLWLLVSICNFSRFISLTPVESLSKDSILLAFENHFRRFGRSESIETDLGTNFSAAKSDLQNEETVEEDAVREITQSLKALEYL
jgi:hypothetical protein